MVIEVIVCDGWVWVKVGWVSIYTFKNYIIFFYRKWTLAHIEYIFNCIYLKIIWLVFINYCYYYYFVTTKAIYRSPWIFHNKRNLFFVSKDKNFFVNIISLKDYLVNLISIIDKLMCLLRS